MKEITIDEVDMNSQQDYLWVDIRSRIAYDHGHILDAVSLPEPLEIESLKKTVEEANRKTVILYCTIGERSKAYVEQLNKQGVEVCNLKNGYRDWLLYCENHLNKEERLQYSRQIILPELGVTGQEKLKNAKVLVIGAGALGTVALTYLAAAGVGHLGIAENDIIESSNLHRQILYGRNDIGRRKIKAAKEQLTKLNPFIEFNLHETFLTPQNISGIIREYDFVIDATDRIETKFLINDACVLEKKAFVHAGVNAFEGQVMTWIPGSYPCYRCIFEDVPDDYIPTCVESGVIGAVTGVIGSVQALEAIKYIAGIGDLLLGKMFVFDGKRMKTRIVKFPHKSGNCQVCGKQAIIEDVSKHLEKYLYRGCELTDD